ncbi:MAG: putative DNA binding domain-containing protein [Proteobacteria bacterium]|nr:putative DNA binding domain-containing protein [Pseudomonadota bacterium]
MTITKDELLVLIKDIESDRIEPTESINDKEKFGKIVCAFSNDMSYHQKPGYLCLGVKNNGDLNGLKVTDNVLQTLSGICSDGNIQPLPRMNVSKIEIDAANEIAIVEVFPSDMPPVRYRGTIWIRIGPRPAVANEQEERVLSERRVSQIKNFDGRACQDSSLDDLNTELFRNTYLPNAVSREVIEENHRKLTIQLASLRFYDVKRNCPTNAGVLLFANDPIA